MLTFLNSFLAWSLLAAAIPILIHLFTRKKLKHIPFSTLQFLRQMQKEKIRQVRLKQWVLRRAHHRQQPVDAQQQPGGDATCAGARGAAPAGLDLHTG